MYLGFPPIVTGNDMRSEYLLPGKTSHCHPGSIEGASPYSHPLLTPESKQMGWEDPAQPQGGGSEERDDTWEAKAWLACLPVALFSLVLKGWVML